MAGDKETYCAVLQLHGRIVYAVDRDRSVVLPDTASSVKQPSLQVN